MPFNDFQNPFQDPAKAPEAYRKHSSLSKLFKQDGTYIRPAADPVTLWAIGIDWSDVLRISPEVHEQLPKSKVYPGDILYSMAGTIGLAALAPENLGECNSNQAIAKIRLKPGTLNPNYLVAFLNSRLGRYQSERI